MLRSTFYILQFTFLLTLTLAYVILLFWIIPQYVDKDKQEMAASYTNYAFTALTTLLFAETAILSLSGVELPVVGGRKK